MDFLIYGIVMFIAGGLFWGLIEHVIGKDKDIE